MISPLLGLLVEASFNRAKFIASAHTFMSLGVIMWSSLCGACISYTAFRAQRRISATSFLVVVNMNKFVVVGYGILVLGEAYKPLAAIGCALALLGGAYYSWDRSELKKRTKAVAASAAAEGDCAEESVALLGDKNKGRGASTAKTA